ncbi:HEAT repeat domain-containing protein [Actinoplanes subtropicus]|uniref:HEAT repeat domain-containing protein n=1 Tax=Actinoplanes subtropicus TaxID=543632 RepID=UPI0004C2FDA9|nr:HEAT repeat domain-containing protein [Actinoplanes subtropicus]
MVPDVRCLAVEALGQRGAVEALPLLREMAEHDDAPLSPDTRMTTNLNLVSEMARQAVRELTR